MQSRSRRRRGRVEIDEAFVAMSAGPCDASLRTSRLASAKAAFAARAETRYNQRTDSTSPSRIEFGSVTDREKRMHETLPAPHTRALAFVASIESRSATVAQCIHLQGLTP